MGYRSKVIMGVPTKAAQELQDVIDVNDLNGEIEQVESNDEIACFEGNYLKWYDSYSDVQAIEAVIKKYEEENSFIVCLGEDGQIHNERGDWNNFVDVTFDMYVSLG